MLPVVLETSLNGRAPDHCGKVRDTYDLGDGRLLIVVTDRLSALDAKFTNGIPGKGEVLARLSTFMFRRIGEWGYHHHFIALITAKNESDILGFKIPPELHGRSMVVKRAQRLDAECIARGYISGSGWKDYGKTGMICGIKLPAGLVESQRLDEPIFTPSTKPDVGHDENISFDVLVGIVGERNAAIMRDRTLGIYDRAHEFAWDRGIIIADTKLEFGIWKDEVIVIDEALTPDSSRFWLKDGYKQGGPQASLDKQGVRDWLEAEKTGKRWKEDGPAPTLIPQLVEATAVKYSVIYKMLTGEEIAA